MTAIDDELLVSALTAAADTFAVPADGIDEILAAARRLEDPWRPRRASRRRSVAPATAGAADHGPRSPGPDAKSGAQRRRRGTGRVIVAALVALGIATIAFGAFGGDSSSGPGGTLAQGPSPHGTPASRARSTSPALASPANGAASSARPSPVPAGSTGPPSLPSEVGQSSKIEETGSLALSVGRGRLGPVTTRLMNLAIGLGGFVADTQTQSGPAAPGTPSYGSITLQVPEASFGAAVAQAQTFGGVTSLSTKGTDVTGQYVDLQARIDALEASRTQYLTIMTKATSISDILAVQSQLDDLQSQIEQLQGELQVLDSQTTYGTLVVSVSEPGTRSAAPPAPRSGIGAAWHGAVSGFAAAFDGLVRGLGPALFVILCLAAVGFLGRLGWRSVRRHAL